MKQATLVQANALYFAALKPEKPVEAEKPKPSKRTK